MEGADDILYGDSERTPTPAAEPVELPQGGPTICSCCRQRHAIIFGRDQEQLGVDNFAGVCAHCWEDYRPCIYCGYLFPVSHGVELFWCSQACCEEDPVMMPEIFVAPGPED